MLWVLGLLVLGQSLLSLRGARRWLAFATRYRAPAEDYAPPLSLIVPCHGTEPGLEENLAAYGHQDYPDYELVFVTSGSDDPASAFAARVSGARLLFVAPRPNEGEKVSKLRAAVSEVRPSSQILVFADSDGRPPANWLRHLVAPLARPEQEAGASTGYRWYVPDRAGLPSVIRAVWNSFIASLLGDHDRNFCWGGSMAVRCETFSRLEVDRYWRGAVSDDYQLTRALNDAGLRVRFVPACLVANHGDCGWRELFSWTTRQIIITRVYAPRLWKLGLAANGFYCAGVAALVCAMPSLPAATLLAAIALVAMATGHARAGGAWAAMPEQRPGIRRLRWAFVALAPLIPLLLLYNFTAAGLTRAIAWRGTLYRLEGPQQTIVGSRE